MPPARRTSARSTPPAPGQTPLQDEVTVGNLPPTKDRPPGRWRGYTTTVTADPYSEYVSAGGYAWYANYARSLPRAIDDVTRDFGDDLYERIMLDAQVASVVNVLKSSILEEGASCAPSVEKEDDPDHEASAELASWCQHALDAMATPFDVVLWDLLDSLALGNRVAEIVWHLAPDKNGKECLLPRVVRPKPRLSTAFVTDSFMEVLGLLALLPGQATIVQPNLLMMDLSQVPNFLPRDKFVIMSFRPRNGDPRGTSILRPAYDPWWLKQQGKPEWLKYISQMASPSLIGYTPENAEPQTEDAAGNPLAAPIMPEQAQATQLATVRNGTALSFPYGAKVDVLTVPADTGNAFETWEDWCDRQIAKAVLNQVLATEESKHQTRAASGTHENVLDTIIRQIKRWVQATLRQDLIRLMVLYNFGQKKLALLPRVQLGHVEEHDFSATATGVAALESSGYLGESQKPGIDEMLGLPRRDVEADAVAAQTALQAAAAQAALNPADTQEQRTESKEMAGGQVAADKAAGVLQARGGKEGQTSAQKVPGSAQQAQKPAQQKGAA